MKLCQGQRVKQLGCINCICYVAMGMILLASLMSFVIMGILLVSHLLIHENEVYLFFSFTK
jgi:hypothetical protein